MIDEDMEKAAEAHFRELECAGLLKRDERGRWKCTPRGHQWLGTLHAFSLAEPKSKPTQPGHDAYASNPPTTLQ